MSERSVFAVDRGLFSDPDFADEPFTEREAWLWLVAEASFKSARRRGASGVVELKRGEFSHSVRFMAEAWKWSKSRVDRFIGRLENRDMLRDVTRDGQKIYFIKNYNKFQIVGIPERDTGRDASRDTSGTAAGQTRNRETGKEEDIGAPQSDAPLGPPPAAEAAPQSDVAEKPKNRRSLAEEAFPRFWAIYPKRDGANPRKPAFDAFCREVARGADPEAITGGARRLAQHHAGEKSPFVPQAVTWLRQQRWVDETLPLANAAPVALPLQPPQPVTDEQWVARLQWAREREEWQARWGPLFGEPGSLVPEHLVTEPFQLLFQALRQKCSHQRKAG